MIIRKGKYNRIRPYDLSLSSVRILDEDFDYVKQLIIDGYFVNRSEVFRFALIRILIEDTRLENVNVIPYTFTSFWLSDKLKKALLKKYDKQIREYYIHLRFYYQSKFKDGFAYIIRNAINKLIKDFKELKLEKIERD